MSSKGKTVEYRRKREQKTDYHKRIRMLKADKPRLVVRRHLKNITVQVISYTPSGDEVIASCDTRELVSLGWKYHRGNIPAGYLIGLLIGKKAAEKKVTEAILDMGSASPVKENVIYAVLKGAIDAGMKIPHNEKVLPSEDRISGKTIADYAASLKSSASEKYKKQFSGYLKNNVLPENITKSFNEIRKKIGV